jgi:phosphatidylserine decarboxylase
MRYVRIHKEGRFIIGTLVLILLFLNLYIYSHYIFGIVPIINIVVSALILFFFAYFFRNPPRKVFIDDPSLVVAPADGTVVVVETTDELEYFGDKRIQISIFMSIFNVHANWFPIRGTVLKSIHHSGRHIAAFLPKSSHENERSTVVIESEGGTQILVRQIAGALARRIVTYAHEGKKCRLNEHIGFIKFGSRVDIFLPLDTEIFVQVGDPTTGNETVIARLNEE